MCRRQGPLRTNSSSFRLLSLGIAIVVAMLVVPAFGAIVCTSEFGASAYYPGLTDLFAGYLGPPGTTLVKPYFLFQDASAQAVTHGSIDADSHTISYTSALFAAHVTGIPVLDSYWGLGTITVPRTFVRNTKEFRPKEH
jgi:hypothetical protein